MTEQQWRDLDDLRKWWNTFCDADLGPPEDFIERMDAAGYAMLKTVTRKALAGMSFAAERGIELGGEMWVLTAKGHKAMTGEIRRT